MADNLAVKIGIFYPADPAGFVPSGIDSYIRSLIKFAPGDIEFTLFGSTSDQNNRPVGRERMTVVGDRQVLHLPIVFSEPSAARSRIPLTVRYMWALWRTIRLGKTSNLDVLDFHRIEPVALFAGDPRPKNLVAHMNVRNIRNRGTDIMWKHAPFVYERLEKRLIPRFDRVFAVQQAVALAFANDHPNIAGRFMHLPPMVDTSIYSPLTAAQFGSGMRLEICRSFGLPPAARLLVFVGRLDHSKDPLLLLAAFRLVARENSDAHLVVVGDGSLRSKIEAVCLEAGLQGRVTLLGARRPSEVARILQAGSLFVMSSAYEGLPIAMLEALATGLPVVSTDVGDVARVVSDGVNGGVCYDRSVDRLAATISKVLAQTQALMGRPCVESIAGYRAERVLQTIYSNYRRQAQAASSPVAG